MLLNKFPSSVLTDSEKRVFFPRRRKSGGIRSYWPSAKLRRSGKKHASKQRLLVL